MRAIPGGGLFGWGAFTPIVGTVIARMQEQPAGIEA